MSADTVWAIVLAAGTGSRFGTHKQFLDLAGRRVLDWSLESARAACDGTVLVLPPGIDGESSAGDNNTVTGGATRSASVRAGLAAIAEDAGIVVVHDAARPLAPLALWHAVIEAVRAGADAAIPVVPVADTIKRVQGTVVVQTLDRRVLVTVQTPQAFRVETLRAAHAGDVEATDDAALVEAIGALVVTVEGDRRNLKLTTPEDLVVARALAGLPT